MGLNIFKAHKQKKEAEEIVVNARFKARLAEEGLEEARNTSSTLINTLLDQKQRYADVIIPDALSVLEKCQKVNRLETKVSQDVLDNFARYDAPQLQTQSVKMTEIIGTGVKGTATGAALALGSMSAVSTFGAASTGTAIASLSGAAASNATLAWFGGGALSAGGAGIAGGTMVLGGIVLAPVAIFAMLKYSQNAEKKLTEAYEYRSAVNKEVAKINAVIEVAQAINQHISLYASTIEGIAQRLKTSYQMLDQALSTNVAHERVVFLKLQTVLLVKAMKQLLAIRLVDDQNSPTQESVTVVSHAQAFTEERVNTLVTNLIAANDHMTTTSDVSSLAPGEQSALYFWLADSQRRKATADNDEPSILVWMVLCLLFGALGYYLHSIEWTYTSLVAFLFSFTGFSGALGRLFNFDSSGLVGTGILAVMGYAAYLFWWA